MLSREDWLMIKSQREQGVYIRDIANRLGAHPKTVSRAIKRGGLPSGKRSGARKSKLDSYKPLVDEELGNEVWNSVVIYRKIREAGYAGGFTILRDYIRPKRVLRQGKETVRFETNPGIQMQSDWGEIWTCVGGERRKAHFIVNPLGFSRRFHFWCCGKEDAEHTYEGMIRAFEHFGGVTERVLVDNQKSAVLSHRHGERVVFNERFVDLACHYGFTPSACKPYRARTKGKVERMVGYIKSNFFARHRSFDSFEQMNNLAEAWLHEEADLRLHGTVKEVVSERFDRERGHLRPLPAVRYDTSYFEKRVVGWDGYIEVRGNRYSVPDDLRGQLVSVRIGLDGHLRVLSGDGAVAEHLMRSRSDGWVTVPSHHARVWAETLNVQRRDLAVYEEVVSCSS